MLPFSPLSIWVVVATKFFEVNCNTLHKVNIEVRNASMSNYCYISVPVRRQEMAQLFVLRWTNSASKLLSLSFWLIALVYALEVAFGVS
ncbi:hypothetical protein GE21DRAFT_1205938 [Neurospora crassa]|nr:hypothetical protein GE21DRAFT_1205938 [Neurospora crassa]